MMPHIPTPIRHPQKPIEVSVDAAINGGQAAIGIIVFAFFGFFIAIFAFYWLVQLVHYMIATDTMWIWFVILGVPILAACITEIYIQIKKMNKKKESR